LRYAGLREGGGMRLYAEFLAAHDVLEDGLAITLGLLRPALQRFEQTVCKTTLQVVQNGIETCGKLLVAFALNMLKCLFYRLNLLSDCRLFLYPGIIPPAVFCNFARGTGATREFDHSFCS